MTTSGVTTTELTRDKIISAALRKIGVLAKGQTPDSEDLLNGTEALNNLVAEFQTLGMPLWSKKTYNVPMIASQETYQIGVGQTVNTPFPLKIIEAWNEPTAGGGRQPMIEVGIYDFYLLPLNSGAIGIPSQFMYQPFINYGILHIWPKPDASAVSTRTLTISYMAPFEDFVNSADTPYFPKEWNNALTYGLASLLAPEYGVPLNDRGMFEKQADKHLETALEFGLEEAPITFAPMAIWR